ncbi:MAG: methyl-accepting chemotaxis protein [Acidobacteriota bacterium]
MDPSQKRASFSLTLKLTFIALAMFLVIAIAGYFLFLGPTLRLLQDSLLGKGKALCDSLAYNASYGVLIANEEELAKSALGVWAEEDVLYVIVYNKTGTEVLFQKPKGEFGPTALAAARSAVKPDATGETTLQHENGMRFIDIARPVFRSEGASTGVEAILEGPSSTKQSTPIGTVHLGLALTDINKARYEFLRLALILAILIVLLGVIGTTLLYRFVIYPLTRIAGAAGKIASGNLTEKVEVGSRDEIGLLAETFNEMLDGLAGLARELKMAGGQLSASASEILTAAEEQSASSREQSVSVNETTATMEELAQTSKQIAENSDKVARTAEETFHTAQTGSKAVEDTISGMMSIKGQTETNTNKIFALSEKIQKINNVVKIINDIADQTKLIAFNAAIEAAGAGEAGKRFSIVAVEVRRLADTVMESIEEIKNTITEIQLATNELIMSSEKGIKDVEEGVNVASRAGEALQKIIAMIRQTTESSKQISLSTQQQRTASEQVVISMKEVSKTANQTASSSKQTISIATELNQLSEQLATVVKRFNLGGGDVEYAEPARRRLRDRERN